MTIATSTITLSGASGDPLRQEKKAFEAQQKADKIAWNLANPDAIPYWTPFNSSLDDLIFPFGRQPDTLLTGSIPNQFQAPACQTCTHDYWIREFTKR